MSPSDFERLGSLVDRLGNATRHASILPVPDSVHKAGLIANAIEVSDELKAFLIERGFNPWGGEE